MLSEWIRSASYWTLDFLRGSSVKKHYEDIKSIIEKNEVTSQKKNLNNILDYASTNVKFYKPYSDYTSLNDFPVINKNVMKEHYDDFQSPEFLQSNVTNMHTSGSTGTPFVVRQNADKRNRCLAEMMYFWGKAGYRIGMKYVYFRIWTSINKKSKISAFSRNVVMCNVLSNDKEKLEEIRQMLKSDRKIKMLLGYASTFENLANYLIECKDTPEMFNVKTIITISELLPETTREKLKLVFGCPVVSHYSNSENGVIAQECIEGKEFHVNIASFKVEILNFDNDDPVPIGEPGRIVITDLFNRAMPIIRYDTGDIGVQRKEAGCAWSSLVLSSVQGRKVDFIFDTKGTKLSPHTVTNYMWGFDKIRQFQFIQEDVKEYTLKLNGAKDYYNDEDFIVTFKGFLGQDAVITIEHVTEIPVLASGKFKYTVCKYNP